VLIFGPFDFFPFFAFGLGFFNFLGHFQKSVPIGAV